MEEGRVIGQDEAPGIRDAEGILLRAREDERDAVEARARYRADGLPSVDAKGPIEDLLRADETVVDVRTSAVVSRHLQRDGTEEFPGRLYVTNQRLMVVGQASLGVELGEIDELTRAGERLLLTLRDGNGLSIDASRPRLLRVQIAAARYFLAGHT